jgi:hypothetical protein
MTVTRNQLWRLAETISSALAVISFLLLLGLHYYFLDHRSNVPDPTSQAVFPLNEHGRIVYLTWLEFLILRIVFWGAVISFLFSVIVEIRINPFGRNYPFIRPGGE